MTVSEEMRTTIGSKTLSNKLKYFRVDPSISSAFRVQPSAKTFIETMNIFIWLFLASMATVSAAAECTEWAESIARQWRSIFTGEDALVEPQRYVGLNSEQYEPDLLDDFHSSVLDSTVPSIPAKFKRGTESHLMHDGPGQLSQPETICKSIPTKPDTNSWDNSVKETEKSTTITVVTEGKGEIKHMKFDAVWE